MQKWGGENEYKSKGVFLHSQYVQGLPFIGIQCKSDNVECSIDYHHYQEKLVNSYFSKRVGWSMNGFRDTIQIISHVSVLNTDR